MGQGHIFNANKMLDELNTSITEKKTKAHQAAEAQNFVQATEILTAAIEHANKILPQVEEQIKNTSRSKTDPKVMHVIEKQTAVTTLCQAMMDEKERFAQKTPKHPSAPTSIDPSSAEENPHTTTDLTLSVTEPAETVQTEKPAEISLAAPVQHASHERILPTIESEPDDQANIELETIKAKLAATEAALQKTQAETQAALKEARQAKIKAETDLQAQIQATRIAQQETQVALQAKAKAETDFQAQLLATLTTQQETQAALQAKLTAAEKALRALQANSKPPAADEDIEKEPITVREPSQDEKDYTDAYFALDALKTEDQNTMLDRAIFNLMEKITELKRNRDADHVPITELTEVLKKTHQRLMGKLSPEIYENLARTMQGHPSTGMKMLGGLMITLAIAMAITAILFAPVLTGLVATTLGFASISLAGEALAAATIATVAVPTIAIALGGLGIFAAGAKQTGLSKEMSDLNQARLTEPTAAIGACV